MDLIISNNTLEHIYPDVLIPILEEFIRLIKSGGVQSHFIDMSDHFAHFDKSISIYNFLKFSNRQWKVIDNKIQPQNRLRYDDYIEIYGKIGMPVSKTKFRAGDSESLKSFNISKEFEKYSIERLAISHCYITSYF